MCVPEQVLKVETDDVTFAKAGRSPGELTIHTQSEAGQVRVTVSDTRAGLPADKLEQVLTPFFTTKIEGMRMMKNLC